MTEENKKRKILICGSGGQVGMMAAHIAKLEKEFPDCEIVTEIDSIGGTVGVGGIVQPKQEPKLHESIKIIEKEMFTPPPTRAERRAKARKKKRR